MLKRLKVIVFSVLLVCIFSASAFSAQPKTENALTERPDSSLYAVVKNENLSGFLNWIISKENLQIIANSVDELDNDSIEMITSVVKSLPLKSVAILVGLTPVKGKEPAPFFQAAFTLNPATAIVADKIEVASAEAKDIASMIVGANSPFVTLLETMIKVEHEPGKILKINNDVFLKAKDGVIFAGSDLNELNNAYKTFTEGENSLVKTFGRKFAADNFILLHLEPKMVKELDGDDKDLDDVQKYFDKPLKIEAGFDYQPDKLTIGFAMNLLEALKEKYSNKYVFKVEPVKGGNISMSGTGGNLSPFLALGTVFAFSEQDIDKEVMDSLNDLFKYLQAFNISKDDVFRLLKGACSLVIGAGSVPVEGFQVPSVFLSKTGEKGSAEAIFNKIASKQFFSQLPGSFEGWTKLLQADSSLSPVPFLVGLRGDTLGLALAEASSLGVNNSLKTSFKELLNIKSVCSFWLDFKSIQDWLNDDKNGVLAILTPLAAFSGYGEIFNAARDVLNAKFSVPSMAFYCPSNEVVFFEFNLVEVEPDQSVLPRIIKLVKLIDAKNKANKSKSK